MFKHNKLLLIFIILAAFSFYNPGFAGVTPEILLGARGIVSLNIEDTSYGDSETVADFSDTSLLIGFRQKLYSNYRGQFVFGFQLLDRDSDLDSPFFHQVFLKIEDRTNILKLGRTRLRSALIEFPTLRDDDAIYFTDILNPFITGENSEENQYGELLEVTHIFKQRYRLNLYGGHVKEDIEITGDDEEVFDFNAIGLQFQYRVPETQKWNREILDQAGISFNSFFGDRLKGPGVRDDALKNIIFSTVLNIYPDPVHFLDLRHQSVYNIGSDDITQLTSYADMAEAESFSMFTSLRYLYRKLETPAFQAALSYGYKDFPDLENDTYQHQIIANCFYRIGDNFDIGLQLQYLKNGGDLKDVFSEDETRIQFALVYSVEQLWNSQFNDRESLLNLEHGYIP